MLRVLRTAVAALLVAAAACSGDAVSPLEPGEASPRQVIYDAPTGGNPGFYFLPPLRRPPSFSGVFDPAQPARVEVCELSAGTCGATVAVFTMGGTGSESVRVDLQAEHYVVNFHAGGYALDPARFYRVRVLVESFELGFADLDVVRNGKEAKGVDTAQYVPLLRNQTLPIKFRIEVGAVNPNEPPVAVQDAVEALGNVTVPVPAPGLLANDTDPDGDALAVVAGTFATTQGGTVTLAADGSFTYLSPAGFTGTDSFAYTVTDGADTAAGTAVVNVAGRVWYVRNTAAAPGDGRDASPFAQLSLAEAASLPGETIFVLYGDGTAAGLDAGITLKAGQSLVGQGIPAALSVVLNGHPVVLLASGAAPTIGRATPGPAVQLATGNTVRGLAVTSSDGAGIAGSAFVSLAVSDAAVAAAGGPALDLRDGALSVDVSALSSAGSAGYGVNLENVSGSLAAASGSVTEAAGVGFRVLGGDAVVSYGGTVSSSAARPVSVRGRSGGSVTFSGAVSATGPGILVQDNTGGTVAFTGPSVSLSTGGSAGVTLLDNAGASVSFSGGGLTATTVGAPAFHASGGGRLSVTGAGNALASTGAAALWVDGVEIGAAGLVFRSISADGGPNGIFLSGTGASGGLTVTGSGAAGSGGQIRNQTGADGSTSGIGVYLASTRAVTLRSMRIADSDNFGIRGVGVDGFLLDGSEVTGTHGDAAAGLEGAISFAGLTGTAGIANSSVSGGLVGNLRVVNAAGVLDRLVIRGSTFGPVSSASGGDAVLLEAEGSAVVNVTAQNSVFTSSRLDLFQVSLDGTASSDVVLLGNQFHNLHPAIVGGGGGVVLGGGNAGSAVRLTYAVDGNSFRGALGSALAVFEAQGAGTFSGTITSNTVGAAGVANSGSAQGSALTLTGVGAGSHVARVSGNELRQYNNFGVLLQLGDNAATGSGSLDATITGNIIAEPGTSSVFKNGVHVNAGLTSGDASQVCADVSGNTLAGSGSGSLAGSDVRLRQRFLTSVRLPGYAGASNDNAAVAAFIQANNAGTPTVLAQNAVATGGPGFTGGAACAQP